MALTLLKLVQLIQAKHPVTKRNSVLRGRNIAFSDGKKGHD